MQQDQRPQAGAAQGVTELNHCHLVVLHLFCRCGCWCVRRLPACLAVLKLTPNRLHVFVAAGVTSFISNTPTPAYASRESCFYMLLTYLCKGRGRRHVLLWGFFFL